jgi:NADH:ubiquinone reductase (H+-translocating)
LTPDPRHHVVILGGGFGGLYATKSLREDAFRVTLVDRRNYHLFQPLLYQVATGALSPANIATPLRAIFKRQRNVEVLMADAIGVDVAERKLLLADGEVRYDTLVVAAGAGHYYFGHDDWMAVAPGLKSIEDATTIRRRVLSAFERAEREPDPARKAVWLTFVLVGGGPTGVELAGAIAEIARYTLAGNFRHIDPASSRIFLLEGSDRVLPPYTPDLSAKARKALEAMGVVVRTGARVVDIQPGVVTVATNGDTQRIESHTVLWSAGVRASPLAKSLADATGAECDRLGRLMVEPDLSLPGHPEVIAIGDIAHVKGVDGKPLPAVAQPAIQEGEYAARLVRDRLHGAFTPPFQYHDRGNMATIGRASAVADLGWVRFAGVIAWLAWLFIHLLYLIGFGNRLLVLMQWGYSYITRNRAARLIVGYDDTTLPPRLPSPNSGEGEGPQARG